MNKLTITQYIIWFIFASWSTLGFIFRTTKCYNDLTNTTDLKRSRTIFYFNFLWDFIFILMAWCYGFFLQLFETIQVQKGIWTTIVFFILQQDLKKQTDYSSWTEIGFFVLYVTFLAFMFQ